MDVCGANMGEKKDDNTKDVDTSRAWAGYSTKGTGHLDLEKKWAAQNYGILKKLKIMPTGRVLDLGCSNGFFLKECERNGVKINGIDVDPAIIDGDTVRKCDIEKERFPFEDGTFDVVFSSGVLQHLAKPPINLMEEARRVLKPGGKLCLSVRNEKSWINTLISLYDNFRHKSTWTPVSLRQMFDHYRLKVLVLEPKFLGMTFLWWVPFKLHIGSSMFIVGEKEA
jgi:SAM-dependent methyltransferase